MEFSHQRVALAFAASAVGIVVTWLTKNPLGLLAPTATLFLFARGRTVLLLYVASAIGLVGALLVVASYAGAARDLAAAWAAFFALALCIGAIVATSASASPNAEAMPAAIRSTTREEAPSYPVIGPSLREKAAPRHAPFVSISAQDDKASAAQLATVSFWGGMPVHMRYWRRQPDGSYRWVESRSEPLREPSGTRLWSSVTTDVDDQRLGQEPPTKIASNPPNDEDAVRAAKFVENLLGNAWAFDAAGRPTYLTPLAQTLVAVTLEEFQAAVDEGHTFFKRTAHPDDYDRISAAWRHSLQTGDPFFLDRRVRRASGIHEWNRTGFVPTRDGQGRITGWYGSMIDLDSHRIAEAELRERERELLQLVNMVPSHLWRLAPDGEPIFFSKRMVDFLGLDVADIDKPGMSRLEALIETIHPDDAAEFRDTLRRCLVTGESFAMRYRLRRADGAYRWMSSHAEPMRDQNGHIVQWYGLCHDIDDQMRAEEALRRSERQLQQLVDAVPVMIWSTTSEGRPSYVNKRFTDVTGATLEDVTAPDGSFNLSVIHPEDKAATAEMVGRSFRTGIPYVIQYRQLRRDGAYRWTETRAEALRDESGAVLQWYGVSVDIDDQMRLYSELEEREAKIRRLVDSDIIGIVIWDLDGRLIEANDAFLRMVQYEREDLQAGLGWFDITPPEWQEVHAREEAEELARTGMMQAREKEYFRKDGSRVPVLIGAACFEGESRQGVAYILDLTERKRAEAALRDRERELQQLIDAVPAMVWSTTPQGTTTYLNKRFTDVTGAVLQNLFAPDGSPAPLSVAHPDDLAASTQVRARAFAAGTPYVLHYRQIRRDGTYRWTETRGEPLRDNSGNIVQWYGVSVDIHDLVTAQQALRDRERELAQLVDMLPGYVRRLTPKGEPIFFNKRLTDFIGVDLAEIGTPGMSRLAPAVEDFVHPDEAAALLAAIRHSVATGEGYAMKYRMRRADGVYRWLDTRGEPVRSHDGAVAQWYVISIDVDDEVRAQEALRERERELSQLVDMVPVLIRRLTPAGEPIFFNKRLVDFFGLGDLSELDKPGMSRLAATIQSLVHVDDASNLLEAARRSFAAGEPFSMKYRMRRADGAYRWVDTRAEPLRNQSGAIVQWYVISLDIDDEMRAEEALRSASAQVAKATQAASLAELSASIAHEVNQPLAAIVANSHACQRWLSAEPANVERAKITVERIIRDANSAAEVVSRIRALFKQSTEARDSTALSGAIAEAHSLMAEEAARRRVRIDIDVESDLPLVSFDRVQIQQVLINLVRNGFEAMDSTQDDRVLGLRARRDGNSIQIEISDRGRGIEFPDKIFEAFFTTKENGMGMGLAICRSIVKSHGGRLWAEKNEPRGATFIFTLPVEAKTAS